MKSQASTILGTNIVTSYTDGTDAIICYGTPTTCNIVSVTYHTAGSALSISLNKVVNAGSSYELNTSKLTDYARINMNYSLPFQVASAVIVLGEYYTINTQNILCSLYGSNSLTCYNDTSNSTTLLTFLGSYTLIVGTSTIYVSNSTAFKYMHFMFQNTVNSTECSCTIFL